MIKTFRREFFQFGITFGLAFYAWSGALGNGQELVSLAVGAVAGVVGGLRGLLILRAFRRHIDVSNNSQEELGTLQLDRPSDWQLRSTTNGIAIAAAVIGFLVWGIMAWL